MRDRQQIEKVAMRQREEKRQWTTWRGANELHPNTGHVPRSDERGRETRLMGNFHGARQDGQWERGRRKGEGRRRQKKRHYNAGRSLRNFLLLLLLLFRTRPGNAALAVKIKKWAWQQMHKSETRPCERREDQTDGQME
jgi:hypothetical protein